ncbi:LOB domain-containing protein 40 [Bienertia sinuspersici]
MNYIPICRAIFQSLLYEACGRVVDPIYGSVGLLYSGQWHHCQVAVDAVLKGLPIMQLSQPSDHLINLSDHHVPSSTPKLYDIRHVSSSKDLRHLHHHLHSPTTSLPVVVPTGSRIPAVDFDQVSINGGDDDDDNSVEKHCMFSGESTDEVELDLTLGFNK